MMRNNLIYLLKIGFTLLMFVFAVSINFAQEAEKKLHKTRIKFEYIKKADESKWLKATLSARINKKYIPTAGVKLNFYIDGDTLTKELGSKETDLNGKLLFPIPEIIEKYKDTAGVYLFLVEFEGSDTLKASDNELEIIDANMMAEFDIDEDSIKIVTVSANFLKFNGDEESIVEADVACYVKRLFGNLKIGEGFLEEGELELMLDEDFSIPGDNNGNIIIVSRIEDSDEFGTIEIENEVPWGNVTTYVEAEEDFEKLSWLNLIVVFVLFMGPILILFYQLMKFYKMGKFSIS